MKISKLFTLALMAVSALAASAQGMEFMPEGSTLQDAVDKAAKEDKMVFLDCYTSWCGPCKMMANTIFPTKEVGDFMNPKFVSIKIDMEKGEGPALAKRLEISAYPTFVIFDKSGKEIGRSVGGSDAERFISRVKEASETPAGPTLAERFEAGERGREFLLQYFDLLGKQYRRAQSNAVAELLLEGQTETFINDSALVKVFVTGITDPYHPSFIYFASHPEVVKPVLGERVYDEKVRSVLTNYSNRFLTKNADGTMTLDKEGFNGYLAHIKDNNLATPLEYDLRTNLAVSERNGDWKTYVDLLDTWTTDKTVDISDFTLAFRAQNMLAKCKDTKAHKSEYKHLKKVLKKRYDDLTSGRRTEQTFPADRRPAKAPKEMLLDVINTIDGKKPADNASAPGKPAGKILPPR